MEIRFRFVLALLFTLFLLGFQSDKMESDLQMVIYEVDPIQSDLRFYWKNEQGAIINTFSALKTQVESKNRRLVFAMNGGMFKTDFSPLGLYVENQKTLAKLNTKNATGNFYLKPNGIFYLTNDNKAAICQTNDYKPTNPVKYATQSGPMLVIAGEIHPAFREGSANVNIRNGVGILPDKTVVFAMSKTKVNLYDFAKYFQDAGCENALYLDGFVSQTYLPEKNLLQTNGRFGVIIAVTADK